jgi:hypothetical protein
MNSEITFMLLGALTALQSGSIERSGPLFTLLVTGRLVPEKEGPYH